MNNRTLLIIAAVVVVALIGGLVWSLRQTEPTAPVTREVPSTRAKPPVTPVAPEAPRAREPTPTPARPVPLPPVERVNDAGIAVRDHRIEGRPGPASPIAGVTIADTRQVIEAAVKACARDFHPAEPARIVVHATLKAAGNRVSAHTVSLSGDGALPQEVRDCVIKAYQEFQTDTLADQSDGEDIVHMPWTLP